MFGAILCTQKVPSGHLIYVDKRCGESDFMFYHANRLLCILSMGLLVGIVNGWSIVDGWRIRGLDVDGLSP